MTCIVIVGDCARVVSSANEPASVPPSAPACHFEMSSLPSRSESVTSTLASLAPFFSVRPVIVTCPSASNAFSASTGSGSSLKMNLDAGRGAVTAGAALTGTGTSASATTGAFNSNV